MKHLQLQIGKKQVLYPSIFLIWLFNISAVIGISLGYMEWFTSKTPLNMLLTFSLFLLVFRLDSMKKMLLFSLFFIGGMFVEWLGVSYGLLFGDYHYGRHFGPKFEGVPWLIGINWAILTFVTGAIASGLVPRFWPKVVLGAFLMVFLDFFMEVSASVFDFWHWEEAVAPLQNYIAWFGVAFLFHWILQRFREQGNTTFAYHLYAAQLFFFVYFFFWNG